MCRNHKYNILVYFSQIYFYDPWEKNLPVKCKDLFKELHVFFPPGYGHTVPLSDGGKAFCIIYSVLGIPFTLLFLTAVVQRIMEFSTRRPVEYLHRRWGMSKPLLAALHASLLAIIIISCFFLIPAIIFSVLEEDWNFLESFYFCFISLSTIGLGDYVPGEGYHQRSRELYKLGITCKCTVHLIIIDVHIYILLLLLTFIHALLFKSVGLGKVLKWFQTKSLLDLKIQ